MTPAKFLTDGVMVMVGLAGVAFLARGLADMIGSSEWAVRWADEVTAARRKVFADEKAAEAQVNAPVIESEPVIKG